MSGRQDRWALCWLSASYSWLHPEWAKSPWAIPGGAASPRANLQCGSDEASPSQNHESSLIRARWESPAFAPSPNGQALEELLVLFGDAIPIPSPCFGAGQLPMPSLELRVVPQPLDDRDPRRDLARGRHDAAARRVPLGDRQHEPGVAQGLGQAPRGRWPAPGCRWPSPPPPPGPATPARATASAPPGSPGRSPAGPACWPSGAGWSAPTGPPARSPARRTSPAPRRPGAGSPAAAGPTPARSGRTPPPPSPAAG